MIDRKLLLNNFEEVKRLLVDRGVDSSTIEQCHENVKKCNKLQAELNKKQSEQNNLSGRTGIGYGYPCTENELKEVKSKTSKLKAEISKLKEDFTCCQNELKKKFFVVPNIPDNETPKGKNSQDNVILYCSPKHESIDLTNKKRFSHWELAKKLGYLDNSRAAKVSGSMFALLRNDGARLLRALVNYALDFYGNGWKECVTPHLVTSSAFTSTGHLPKFKDQSYYIGEDDLWLIPTGEVPLTSMYMNEVIKEEELPIRNMAYTLCFRRESGAAGSETRGMQRLHEFHKVELVSICAPNEAKKEHQFMVNSIRKMVESLGLQYRVVDICTGDLTFSSSRLFDIEIYSPGIKRWLEFSSIGLFTDFQARRGNIRYCKPGKKPDYVYTINGSAMATPRIWAALLEHGQQDDGTILIPKPLVPYMKKDRLGSK